MGILTRLFPATFCWACPLLLAVFVSALVSCLLWNHQTHKPQDCYHRWVHLTPLRFYITILLTSLTLYPLFQILAVKSQRDCWCLTLRVLVVFATPWRSVCFSFLILMLQVTSLREFLTSQARHAFVSDEWSAGREVLVPAHVGWFFFSYTSGRAAVVLLFQC